jgi:hypothetical protein
MLIRNLRRPGDFARAVIANNDQLRIEIANDKRMSKARENVKRGIPEQQEDLRDLSERIGDANQRRQTSIDNLRQIFTAEQVDRFLSVLDDDTFQFLNLYWKDMKSDLLKKADVKLMDEFFFKNYLNKYTSIIMDQKGLSAPAGTQASVNEVEELLSLFTWKDAANKAFDRLSKVAPDASKELGALLKLVPDRRRIDRIRSLPDAEKQMVITNLSDAFSGINPDPAKWNKALEQSNNQAFYLSTQPLYRNMTEAQKQSALDTIDYLNDPLSGAKSFFDEPEPAPTGTPAEEPKAKPKAKKGLIVATAVEGEARGETAEARRIDESDYMSPADFDREEVGIVGKQMRYITLLKQTDALPEELKYQIFYNREIGKSNPISYYQKPKQEGVNNRQLFYSRLVTYDKQIKSAFELKAKEPKEGIGIKRKPGRPKSGKGIASTCKEQTPRWIELGRYRINGRLLDEKQLLSVRYQSGTAAPQFPKMIPISDAFHELLTNLFETKKLDKRLMKELDPEEQRTAEVLLVKSGVGRSFGVKEITPTNDEQKKMKRFEVVKGSYLAGNNAPAVIHELRSLIIHFVETGHLSRKEGLRSLMELQ